MRLQNVPLCFVVQRVRGQIENHFAEEIVGTIADVVPDSDFEQAILQISSTKAFVYECLTPARLVRQS